MPTKKSKPKNYDEWKGRVDAFLRDKLAGLSSDDLPDCPYRDWYEDGVSPLSAATRAIRNAKE